MTDPQHITRDATHEHDEDPEQHIGELLTFVPDPDWEVITDGSADVRLDEAAQ